MKRDYLSLTAKIISVIYIVLLTILSFDERLFSLGFLIHSLPTIIFIGILTLAWFKPKIGGILFIIAGIGTIIMFNTYRDWVVFIIISIMPILSGVLFWLSKK